MKITTKKASQIADEIVAVLELIGELNWQRIEAWSHFRALQKELKDHVKYNRTINLK